MGNFESYIRHYDSIWISYMAAILIFFIISSLKPWEDMEDTWTICILDLLESCIHFFLSRLIMISLIKLSDSGPLGSLVGFKGVARLEASGSDKQPLPNHAILSKSSQDQV